MNDSFDRYSSCKVIGHSIVYSLFKNHILSKVEDLHKISVESTKKVSFDKRVYECYNIKFEYNIIVISEDTQQIILRTQLFVNHYALLHEQRDTPNFTLSNYFSILLSISKQ